MSDHRNATTTEGRVRSVQMTSTTVRSAKAKFGALVVVCAKCAKRQKVSAKAVGKLLKEAYAAGPSTAKRRKLRVIETGCLGPCPKRAVAVGTAQSLAEGKVRLLDLETGRDGARAVVFTEFGPIAGLVPAEDTPETGEGPSASRTSHADL